MGRTSVRVRLNLREYGCPTIFCWWYWKWQELAGTDRYPCNNFKQAPVRAYDYDRVRGVEKDNDVHFARVCDYLAELGLLWLRVYESNWIELQISSNVNDTKIKYHWLILSIQFECSIEYENVLIGTCQDCGQVYSRVNQYHIQYRNDLLNMLFFRRTKSNCIK